MLLTIDHVAEVTAPAHLLAGVTLAPLTLQSGTPIMAEFHKKLRARSSYRRTDPRADCSAGTAMSDGSLSRVCIFSSFKTITCSQMQPDDEISDSVQSMTRRRESGKREDTLPSPRDCF